MRTHTGTQPKTRSASSPTEPRLRETIASLRDELSRLRDAYDKVRERGDRLQAALEVERDRRTALTARLEETARRRTEENARARKEREALLSSLSWRVTRPLRVANAMLGRKGGRIR